MRKRRDWIDSYPKTDVNHNRPKTWLTKWIQKNFEPESFVNWLLCMYFGAVLFYIMFTA